MRRDPTHPTDRTHPLTRLLTRDLESAAAVRQPGYVDAVKRAALSVDGEWIVIGTELLEAIQSQFGGPLDRSGCCGD
jgi:hypothetical protein